MDVPENAPENAVPENAQGKTCQKCQAHRREGGAEEGIAKEEGSVSQPEERPRASARPFCLRYS